MTRFKFFGFLLPLAMAGGLVLGLAPALANHDCTNPQWESHKHCSPDGTNSNDGEPALLTLTGDMSTPTSLVGEISQNSPKRFQFRKHNFGGSGIRVHLDEPLDSTNCRVDPTFDPDLPGTPSDQDLLDELNDAVIPTGFVIIKVDKKKATVEFSIEYFINELGHPLEGRIRIFFREDLGRTGIFPVASGDLDFPGITTINGSIAIWWSNLTGLNEDKILVCDGADDHHFSGRDGHEVRMELTVP